MESVNNLNIFHYKTWQKLQSVKKKNTRDLNKVPYKANKDKH